LIYVGVSSLINQTFKQPITIQLQHQKGGQFAAKNTGQFVAKRGGQFTTKKGGHFTRNLHLGKWSPSIDFVLSAEDRYIS